MLSSQHCIRQVHDNGISLLVPSWYPMHIAASSLDKSFSALFHSTAYTISSRNITPHRCCLDGTVTNSHSEEREEGAERLASNWHREVKGDVWDVESRKEHQRESTQCQRTAREKYFTFSFISATRKRGAFSPRLPSQECKCSVTKPWEWWWYQ